MDPLSEILSLLKLRTYMSGGFRASGDWSIEFGQHEGIKFYAVVSGECWLAVTGVAEPVRVTAGDCILLPAGLPFRVASDLSLQSTDGISLPAKSNGGVTVFNGGGTFFSVGGYFTLMGDHAPTLLGLLPKIVHIRKESDTTVLHWCLDRLRQELQEPQPGGSLVAQQLASLMLLQALRLHLTERAKSDVGWLFALADKQMGAAIQAMHTDPARRWTLQSLAESVGMSRTTFTLKFRDTVGMSVMNYLTRWRMMLAGVRLTSSEDPISIIAQSLGYESESSFNTAFKRVVGISPRKYSRGGLPPGRHTPHPNFADGDNRPQRESRPAGSRQPKRSFTGSSRFSLHPR